MKYYLNVFMIFTLAFSIIGIGTIVGISFYDPKAAELVQITVDCIVKLLTWGY